MLRFPFCIILSGLFLFMACSPSEDFTVDIIDQKIFEKLRALTLKSTERLP